MRGTYGPHDPLEGPTTVTVRGPGKWAKDREVALPDLLAEQRRYINELAACDTPDGGGAGMEKSDLSHSHADG